MIWGSSCSFALLMSSLAFLDAPLLLAATIFATKGVFEKSIKPMGKGFMARQEARKCHITVALREASGPEKSARAAAASVVGPIGRGRRAPRGTDFAARVVAPAMASLPRSRPRFAYATEV